MSLGTDRIPLINIYCELLEEDYHIIVNENKKLKKELKDALTNQDILKEDCKILEEENRNLKKLLKKT